MGSTKDISEGCYGVSNPIQSTGEHRDRVYTDVQDLNIKMLGQSVWVRARLHTSKMIGKECFVILRQCTSKVQLLISAENERTSQKFVEFAGAITKESVVDVFATVVKATEPAMFRDVTLIGAELWTVSAAVADLPFPVDDDPDAPHVDLDLRLDYRFLDLRTTANHAIFRIKAGICRLFQEIATKKGYMHIHVPKIVDAQFNQEHKTFSMQHFDKTAYLVATSGLHKQMALAGGFEKIFTIDTVFRTDPITHLHLSEFMRMDLMMVIRHHYHEMMDIFVEVCMEIFRALEAQYAPEIATVHKQYNLKPLKFTVPPPYLEYPQALHMLREAGVTLGEEDELSKPNEKLLGDLVRAKYDTDFFILDKLPVATKQFYVMPDAKNPKASNSFDMFMRGQEVLSGIQRVYDRDMLIEQAKKRGIDTINKNVYYFDSFKYGYPPHGSGSIGLERMVMLFLGLDDIRLASVFPRYSTRLTP